MSARRSGLVGVTGAGGMLGREILSAAAARGQEIVGWSRQDFDVTDAAATRRAIAAARPRCVIHAAAWTDVDACESNPARALLLNGHATELVADACRAAGARLIVVSTDYVFSGEKEGPYFEGDARAPLSAYGRSKVVAEDAALALAADGVVARTAWLYADHGRNFFRTMLRLADGPDEIRVVDDQRGSPTWAGDVAPRLLDLALSAASGAFHVVNAASATWHGFAERILAEAGRDRAVRRIASGDLPRPAPRPRSSVLADTRLASVGIDPLPSWEDALARCVRRSQRSAAR